MALYCSGCGQSIEADANFCSACGKSVREAGFPAAVRGPLVRPLAGRKIAGVCLAFAQRFGWNANLTRVFAVLITCSIFPVAIVAYLLLWVIVPQEPHTALTATHVTS